VRVGVFHCACVMCVRARVCAWVCVSVSVYVCVRACLRAWELG